jgi:hypothetical protein
LERRAVRIQGAFLELNKEMKQAVESRKSPLNHLKKQLIEYFFLEGGSRPSLKEFNLRTGRNLTVAEQQTEISNALEILKRWLRRSGIRQSNDLTMSA